MCNRRLPVGAAFLLVVLAGFTPRANAAALTDTERLNGPGLEAHLELWLLGAIEKVEALFNLKVQALPAPAGGPPSIQSDCRSGIDPNGGGCVP